MLGSENIAGPSKPTELDTNPSLQFGLIAFIFTCTIYLPQAVQAFFLCCNLFVFFTWVLDFFFKETNHMLPVWSKYVNSPSSKTQNGGIMW